MSEKAIVKKIMDYLKTLPECFYWKEHGGQFGTAGIPDIICCYKGKFLAFEVKAEKGKLTVLQKITIDRINDAGGIAAKVTNLEEVKKILSEVKNERSNKKHINNGL